MLNYYYDKEADVFYFSQGTPSEKDETVEAQDDVLIRINPRTKRVRGFTLLNASHRTRGLKRQNATPLPFSLTTKAS